jgi:TM2 domain-containing membrane protein YozV/ribosomal protein L40E
MSEPSDSPENQNRERDQVYCRNCGERIDPDAEICPHCGVRQLPPPQSAVGSSLDDLLEGGNPFIAAVLSALFPGLGQIYNRQLEKGLAIIVVSFLTMLSTLVLIGFVLFPIVWLYAIYDAYKVADAMEKPQVTSGTPE